MLIRRARSRGRRVLALAGLIATALAGCTDDSSATADRATTTLGSTVVEPPVPDVSVSVGDQLPSFDACRILREEIAQRVLGVSADAPVTQTASGEECTWHADTDPTRVVNLTQGPRRDAERFLADHVGMSDIATDEQKASGLHIGVEKVAPGVVITMLLSDRTYSMSSTTEVADVPKLVAEMLGIG